MIEDEDAISVDYDAARDVGPVAASFLRSDAFVRCLMGPVGSAKSSTCCVEALRRSSETPPGLDGVRRSRGVIIRNTYPELRDTTMGTFREWIPSQLGTWKTSEHIFVFDFTPDDGVPVYGEVLFRALDSPDDIRSLLSLELTWAWINEAREIEKPVFKMLLTRLRRFPSPRSLARGTKYWSGLWMDTNPPDDDHWLYKRFEEEKPPGNVLFRQPGGRSKGAENLKNLDRDYYRDIVANNQDDPDHIKVYVDAEYGSPRDGKPIYPEYKDSVHCTDQFDARPELEVLCGMDFGLTPAIVFGQRDPRDGQLQIFDEMVSEDMGARRFADEVVKHLKRAYPGRPVRGYGDPAGDIRAQTDERTPFDIVNAAGLPLGSAPTNDFILRREAVAGGLSRLTMMGRPGLVIHPRCRVLRKAMHSKYCYRKLKLANREAYADKPDKNKWSHVAEGLQYLCVGDGEDARPLSASHPSQERPAALRFRVRRAYGG